MSRLHAVLLAGGRGERFWPRSRISTPKQFLPLTSGTPILRETAERLLGMAETFWCLTGRGDTDKAADALSGLDARVIGEPSGKSTAPAVGVVAARVAREDPETILVVLPSDHHIDGIPAFRSVITEAAEAAAGGGLVCLGLSPTRPETGYGYIIPGEVLSGNLHRVDEFVEKPPRDLAKDLISRGGLWNGGIFAFRAGTYLEEVSRHLPDLFAALERIEAEREKDRSERLPEGAWETAPKISIDHGIMEKTERALVVRAEIAWDDIGDWSFIDRLGEDRGGIKVSRGEVLSLDSERVLVDSDEGLIALLGVEDLVIVRDRDVVLVARRGHEQDVREIVKRLRENPERRRYE